MAPSLHLPADVEAMTPEEILGLLLEELPGRVALACSFQKEESVLLDMLFALEPGARVFALDTHVLFPETYALWREVEREHARLRLEREEHVEQHRLLLLEGARERDAIRELLEEKRQHLFGAERLDVSG